MRISWDYRNPNGLTCFQKDSRSEMAVVKLVITKSQQLQIVQGDSYHGSPSSTVFFCRGF